MSFRDDYMRMTQGTSPAEEFHIGTMLSVLSTIAGRRFWFDFGPYKFYTNLYVGLVGDPGLAKTSAMSRGKNIVRAAQICPIAASQETKEYISQQMSSTLDGKPKKVPFAGQRFVTIEGHQREYNQYAIFATELVNFIAVNPQGFLDFLTTVWDEPIYEVKTKHQGQDLVVGPYITFLACMTPSSLQGYLKQSILSGGFARRTMWFYAAHDNAVPIPSYDKEQELAELRCIDFAEQMKTKCGVFRWTDETKAFYLDWFHENNAAWKDRHPATRGWFKSKGEILFKLSMLIALAEEEGERLVIELPYYKLAMYYCSMVEKNLERVFEGAGINPASAVASQICHMLEAMNAPMNKKHLEAMFFDSAPNLNELRDTLGHLVNVGRLAEFNIKNEQGQLLGTLIGVPSCLTNYTASELAGFLKRPVAPIDGKGLGLSPTSGPSTLPGNQP